MSQLQYWVWLSMRFGVRPKVKLALVEHFGTPRDVYFATEADYRVRVPLRPRMKALSQKLGEMNEFDISEFLGELWEDNPQRMAMVFRILSKEIAAAVFANLEVEEQETIINSITDTELAGIIEELYVDDAVDMMEELPANVVKRVMRTATPATRNLINQYLKYPENSAGSIMTAEFVDLKKYMSVREAFARIRKIGEDKETIYVCYVTSAKRKLEGVVTVKDLLLSDDDVILEDIMDTNVIYASTTDDQEEVSDMISNYDLIAIPRAFSRHFFNDLLQNDAKKTRIFEHPWKPFT